MTRKAPQVNSTINVTPMVDVMLVLLIIFMVITPMLTPGLSVEMAKTPGEDARTATIFLE
jgi:biopolymer transport protein ExbD